jgi:hypothetical protein
MGAQGVDVLPINSGTAMVLRLQGEWWLPECLMYWNVPVRHQLMV